MGKEEDSKQQNNISQRIYEIVDRRALDHPGMSPEVAVVVEKAVKDVIGVALKRAESDGRTQDSEMLNYVLINLLRLEDFTNKVRTAVETEGNAPKETQ